MIIFNYDDLGVFRYKSEAKVDPLDKDKFLIPRNATTVSPPTTGDYESAVFSGGEWSVVPDYRGVPYYVLPDRTPRFIGLGVDLPQGGVLDLPPLTEEEIRSELISGIISKINENTDSVIANYTHQPNGEQYNLTKNVINQIVNIKLETMTAADQTACFPCDVVLDEKDGVETTVTIGTVAVFNNAVYEVLKWVREKGEEARAIKSSLPSMTTEELNNWVDPRL